MGIDIGSRTTKGVIIDNAELMVYGSITSGTDYARGAEELRQKLLAKARLSHDKIARAVATGHSVSVPFADENATDIQCCARGIFRAAPSVRTVIDIQAQTSQVVRLAESGLVSNFVVSEKCAAGSGRFLDVVANVLRMDIQDIGPLSLKSTNPVTFSTGCAVFGESEAISRVAEGIAKEDILAGVHKSVADKISGLVARVGMQEPCAISGGGGLDIGLVKAIENKLGVKLIVPSHPDMIAALGAASIAASR